MHEAGDKDNTAGVTCDDDFEPLAPALELWLDSDKPSVKFVELTEYVQERIAGAMGLSIPAAPSPEEVQERSARAKKFGIPPALLPEGVQERSARAWALSMAAAIRDVCSLNRQRSMVRQWDIENHPGLAVEVKALQEKNLEVDKCARIASNIPIEVRTMIDIESQKKELHRLREQEAALKVALQRKAESFGLAWPAGSWMTPEIVTDTVSLPGGGPTCHSATAELRAVQPVPVSDTQTSEPTGDEIAAQAEARRQIWDPLVRQQDGTQQAKVAAALIEWAKPFFPDQSPGTPELLKRHRKLFGKLPKITAVTMRVVRQKLATDEAKRKRPGKNSEIPG